MVAVGTLTIDWGVVFGAQMTRMMKMCSMSSRQS